MITTDVTYPNGRVAYVYETLFNGGLLCLRNADPELDTHDDEWQYDTFAQALAALELWDGEGEPRGWIRNPRTARRRPDGDPEREYVRR